MHGAKNPVPASGLDDLPALFVWNILQWLTRQMAVDAGFVLLLNRIPYLGFPVGVNDGAVLADDTNPLNALLLAQVFDDLLDNIAFVDEHRVAGAGHHHLGELGHVPRNHTLHVFLTVLENQPRKRQHRR